MAWNGSGTFLRVHNWQQDQQNSIKILPDRHDAEDDNIAAGFSNCMPRDGQAPATGNQNMGDNRVINLSTPAADTDASTKKYVDDAIAAALSAAESVPIGTLVPFGSVANLPAGYLLCDGQAVNRTGTYAPLFAVIGTNFGVGDGTTTFNVPDLVDKHIEGTATDGNVGNALAAEVGTHNHTASTTVDGHTHSVLAHTHAIDHDHGSVNTSDDDHTHTHNFDDNNRWFRRNYAGDISSTFVNNGMYWQSQGGTDSNRATNANHQHIHNHSVNLPAFVGNSGSAGGGNTGSFQPGATTTITEHSGTNRPASVSIPYMIKY